MSVETAIRSKLTEALEPEAVEIVNESHLHAGHAGSPGTGSSHFAVAVVSARFDGMTRVARQRLVYDILKDELAGPVHALALTCRTPDEAARR